MLGTRGLQMRTHSVLGLPLPKARGHADHHYPHSKGGATSMANAVAACQRHGTSSGAKMPTGWDTRLIALRRRSYFPPDVLRRTGQWF